MLLVWYFFFFFLLASVHNIFDDIFTWSASQSFTPTTLPTRFEIGPHRSTVWPFDLYVYNDSFVYQWLTFRKHFSHPGWNLAVLYCRHRKSSGGETSVGNKDNVPLLYLLLFVLDVDLNHSFLSLFFLFPPLFQHCWTSWLWNSSEMRLEQNLGNMAVKCDTLYYIICEFDHYRAKMYRPGGINTVEQ